MKAMIDVIYDALEKVGAKQDDILEVSRSNGVIHVTGSQGREYEIIVRPSNGYLPKSFGPGWGQ